MNCKKHRDKIIFFLEGDLPGHEMEEVRHHLAECGDCAAFAEELKKTLGVLQEERSPEVNPFFYTRLKARMEAPAAEMLRAEQRPAWERVLQPVFFSLLLLLGIYAGITIGRPSPEPVTVASYPGEQVIPYLNEMETEPIEAFLME